VARLTFDTPGIGAREPEAWLAMRRIPLTPRLLGIGVSVGLIASALVPAAPSSPVAAAPAPATAAVSTPDQPPWLVRVNHHRAQAGLHALLERRKLSRASRNHAVYMHRTGDFSHRERSGSPYRTKAGARAAAKGLISYGSSPADAVSMWMRGPFHALTLLRGDVTHVGLGSSGGYVTLMVNGRSKVAGREVSWPGHGASTSLRSAVPESPDPRSGCGAAWRSRAADRLGLPIVTTWKKVPAGVTARVRRDGAAVPVCVLTAATGGMNGLGRLMLRKHRAVVLVPLDRLEPGGTYTADVRSRGTTRTWNFTAT
jgi:hypothetical protein